MLDDVPADGESGGELAEELVALHEPGVLHAVALLPDLERVVEYADGARPIGERRRSQLVRSAIRSLS